MNSLLDMTRIQSGTLEVRRRPWSLRDIVNEALAELHSSLAGRQIDVVLPDGLPFVDVDPLLISQVLANLVDNANRHGPPGTPLTVAATVRGQDRLTVSVSDRGPGVPAAEREAISRSLSGSTPAAARAWGWPSPKRSSRLTATASGSRPLRTGGPLRVHSAGRCSRRAGSIGQWPACSWSTMTRPCSALCRVSLNLKGHEVLTAATGEQGISQAALTSPDVIVLDLGLPDIDGLKVCRRIREWDDVPIVVLSAIGSEDRKVAALDEGRGRLHDQALRSG